MMRIAGIDIGGTNIKVGVIEKFHDVKDFLSINTRVENIVNQIIEIIKELNVDAVGIGIAGLVSNGIVYYSPNLPGINKLNLKKELNDKLKIPIIIDNDANMVAIGEWQYGAGVGYHNLIAITLGTGVGGGIIINDKLYSGNGFAGEIGHMTIDPNGPHCGCGNYGCIESFIGSNAIIRKATQGIKIGIKTSLSKYADITPEIISKEAYNGDEFAKSIIEQIGYYLAIGVANLYSILDPDIIIIGGGVSKFGNILFNKIQKEIKLHLYFQKEIKIANAKLIDLAGIVGSAYCAYQML